MGNKILQIVKKAKIVKHGLFKREDTNLINYLRDSSKKAKAIFRELKKLEVQAKKSIR